MRAVRFRICASRLINYYNLQFSHSKFQKWTVQPSRTLYLHTPCFNTSSTVEQPIVNDKLVKENKKYDDFISFDDPDSFGLLSKANAAFSEKYEHDEGDQKEEDFTNYSPLPSGQLRIKEYSDLIKDHLDRNRVKEALDVLEVKMLQEDKVKPDSYIYNLLISGCARVGYTKKAFMLFNDMKRRGLKVTRGTYTSLFNACANSPWPADGLKRAFDLRILMKEKLVEPNLTNYNSMIKAFGRCGDIQNAFSIVDEMRSKKIKIRVHSFNFLLQSCITDKNMGFTHALLTWRKMLSIKEKPNIYTFNLMLRCAKECRLAYFNTEFIQKVIPDFSEQRIENDTNSSNSDSKEIECTEFANSNELTLHAADKFPNLLSKTPHMGSVVSINQINSPQDKLMLIGGLDDFLKEFDVYNVTPDIKTVTQLLDLAPNTIDSEEKLLSVIKHHKIKTDIDFYNMLMRRRCFRHDYDAAKDVLNIVKKRNAPYTKRFYLKKNILKPNIMTYGILAMTCQNLEDTKKFLKEMKESKLRVNSQIMGTFLNNAAFNGDFERLLFILDYIKEEKIVLNDVFFDKIDKFRKISKRRVSIIEKNKEKTADEINFVERRKSFFQYYNQWVTTVKKSTEESEYDHPWKQFREKQPVPFQKPTLGRVKGIRYHKKENVKFVKYRVKI